MSIVVSTLRHYYEEDGSDGGGVPFTVGQEGRAVNVDEIIQIEDDVSSFSNNDIYVLLSRIRRDTSFIVGRGDIDLADDGSLNVSMM